MSGRAIKVVGATVGAFGILLSGYAQFVYDPTIAPSEMPSIYSDVSSTSPQSEKYVAISERSDRLDRTLAGETIVSPERVAGQRQMFYIGLLLVGVGLAIFLYGRSQIDDELEENQ